MLDDNELLFDELYEKTKDCGRVQFINLLMEKERENQELKEQLEDEQNYSQSVFSDFQDYKEEASAYLDKIENQQQEFIEWLENKIKYWEEQEQQWLNLGFMKFGGEANNKIIFKKILSKYKEIIGGLDEQ